MIESGWGFISSSQMNTKELHALFLNHSVICTDTRVNKQGSLFFGLKGENFNGNRFAWQALETGSSFAIVDDPEYLHDDRCILVDDVLKSLQDLATCHRKYLNIPILAITGSNGKTTTKELCHTVLSQKFNTVSTQGNLNNHIGVPLTLLRATSKTEIMVVEMGANHLNEIAFLCEIAQPNYGIITNIGKAHLEGLGSFEGIVRTKKELYDYIAINAGELFVNSDNQLLIELSADQKKSTYGLTGTPDIKGYGVEIDPFVSIKVGIRTNDGNMITAGKLESNLPGKYNLENILAATVVGIRFNVDFDLIAGAIHQYIPENNRSQLLNTKLNRVIMDAYNANPTSMEHAITNFIEMPGTNKTLIIGDMMELGDQTDQEHELVLSLIDLHRFTTVILVGEFFNRVIGNRDYVSVLDTNAAIDRVMKNPVEDQQVLLKGSRLIGLEKIIKVL